MDLPAFGQIYQQETFDLGISPAWTLCVEMTFYALLPVYALLVARLSPRPRSAWTDVVPLVLLASASLAFHAVYVDKSNFKIASTLPGTFFWFSLGMGVAVASVWAAHGGDRGPVRFVERYGTLCWVAAVAAFLVLCAAVKPTGFHSGNLVEHVVFQALLPFSYCCRRYSGRERRAYPGGCCRCAGSRG